MIHEVKRELGKLKDPDRASNLQRFFKTGRGEYGEGDRFLGIGVPEMRKLAGRFRAMSLEEISTLLLSPWHEERFFALLLMTDRFKKGNPQEKEAVYCLYMDNPDNINNWDLVDVSAPHIPGAWLFGRERAPLYLFASSEHLWKKRIAIVATQYFIRKRDFSDTLAIARILINDEHDLIHKAVGWMLREVGNRDISAEEEFLRECYGEMPRTMLRYAIEKFPEELRMEYLKGTI